MVGESKRVLVQPGFFVGWVDSAGKNLACGMCVFGLGLGKRESFAMVRTKAFSPEKNTAERPWDWAFGLVPGLEKGT